MAQVRVVTLASVFSVVLAIVTVPSLVEAPLAGADTATTLFSSSTPGFTASATTVPQSICFVSISASGGAGASGDLGTVAGGAGATVTARLPVAPGEALSVLVAGEGGLWASSGGGVGGFGGGGGGDGPGDESGGGGASVVTTGAGTPLVVAGGGGAGADGITPGNGGTPGNSGGSSNVGTGGSATGAGGAALDGGGGGGGITTGGSDPDGDNGGSGNATGTVGGGGGSTGGVGGTGGTGSGQGGIGGTSELGHLTGGNGGNGDGSGGNGANANSGPLTLTYAGTENGGGGGGGDGFGGGAGGGGGAGYGGGGPAAGGSSYVSPSATHIAASSANLGGGSVQITYDPITDTCPTTRVIFPFSNATLSGPHQLLDALAWPPATRVQYEITGGGLTDSVIATAIPTRFGWIAFWNTTGVANGSYTLQSVASYPGGVSVTSPPVTVDVDNHNHSKRPHGA